MSGKKYTETKLEQCARILAEDVELAERYAKVLAEIKEIKKDWDEEDVKLAERYARTLAELEYHHHDVV